MPPEQKQKAQTMLSKSLYFTPQVAAALKNNPAATSEQLGNVLKHLPQQLERAGLAYGRKYRPTDIAYGTKVEDYAKRLFKNSEFAKDIVNKPDATTKKLLNAVRELGLDGISDLMKEYRDKTRGRFLSQIPKPVGKVARA